MLASVVVGALTPADERVGIFLDKVFHVRKPHTTPPRIMSEQPGSTAYDWQMKPWARQPWGAGTRPANEEGRDSMTWESIKSKRLYL